MSHHRGAPSRSQTRKAASRQSVQSLLPHAALLPTVQSLRDRRSYHQRRLAGTVGAEDELPARRPVFKLGETPEIVDVEASRHLPKFYLKISETRRPSPPNNGSGTQSAAEYCTALPSGAIAVMVRALSSTIQKSWQPFARQREARSRNSAQVFNADLTSMTSSGAPRRLSSRSIASQRSCEIKATSAARRSNCGTARKGISMPPTPRCSVLGRRRSSSRVCSL